MTDLNTKDRLLDAAEPLFAKKGYDAVSIREIAGTADVNLAAVNYHFQGKHNLYVEVLRRRLGPKRDKLMAAFDEVEAADEGSPKLEMLIRAFLRTHLQDALAHPRGLLGLHLMSREMSEPRHGATVLFKELIGPVRTRIMSMFRVLLPQADEKQAQMIIMSLVGQFVYYAMFWHNHRNLIEESHEEDAAFVPLGDDIEAYMSNVIDHVTFFTMGGIREIIEGGTT